MLSDFIHCSKYTLFTAQTLNKFLISFDVDAQYLVNLSSTNISNFDIMFIAMLVQLVQFAVVAIAKYLNKMPEIN